MGPGGLICTKNMYVRKLGINKRHSGRGEGLAYFRAVRVGDAVAEDARASAPHTPDTVCNGIAFIVEREDENGSGICWPPPQ